MTTLLMFDSLKTTQIGSTILNKMAASARVQHRKIDTNYACASILMAISACKQRQHLSPTECSLNEYMILTGNSGDGKSVALNAVREHQRRYMPHTIAPTFASGSALRKFMSADAEGASRASLLWIDDEFARFAQSAADGQSAHPRELLMLLLELWSSPPTLPAQEAATADAKTKPVEHPRFSIFAATVPDLIATALKTPQIRESGLLSRLLLVPSGNKIDPETIPDKPLDPGWRQTLYGAAPLAWDPGTTPPYESGKGKWGFFANWYREQAADGQTGSPIKHGNVRAAEHVARIASLIALAHHRQTVTVEDLDVAHDFVIVCIDNFINIMEMTKGPPTHRLEKYRRVQNAVERAVEKMRYTANLLRVEDDWIDDLPDRNLNTILGVLHDLGIIIVSHESKHSSFRPGANWGMSAIDLIQNSKLDNRTKEIDRYFNQDANV